MMSTVLSENFSSEMMNTSPHTSEIPAFAAEIVNPTSDSIDVNEPPTKICKITSNNERHLLEDRIGSILSCCICLQLSALPIFQVNFEMVPLGNYKELFFLSLTSVLMDI